MLSAATPLEGW